MKYPRLTPRPDKRLTHPPIVEAQTLLCPSCWVRSFQNSPPNDQLKRLFTSFDWRRRSWFQVLLFVTKCVSWMAFTVDASPCAKVSVNWVTSLLAKYVSEITETWSKFASLRR